VVLVFYQYLSVCHSRLQVNIINGGNNNNNNNTKKFKKINQPDASISQIYCSSFKYSSTCFGHPLAHHQELINSSSRLWFTVGTWWQQCCWSWSVMSDRPRPTALLPPSSYDKPEAATAVYKPLMMGMRMPETC